MRWIFLTALIGATVAPQIAEAQEACRFNYPVGAGDSSQPLSNNHPVGGMNLPQYGSHLGADYWSGGGCTDFGQPVYSVADGEIVEIVDALGSYLDVVVIRHDVPDLGNVYSMYGHIARDDALSEGQRVTMRQQIGTIDNVLAYFSPCHLHFELQNEVAYQQGPFCNGCANAGYHVSPGYDRQNGVREGTTGSGDRYLEVLNDGIDGNFWFFTNEFIDRRVNAECGTPNFELAASSYPARIHRDAPNGGVSLSVRNNGTLPWTGDSFRLATTEANVFWIEGADGYCNAPNDCRVFLGRDVAPGETVDLAFQIRLDEAPLQDGATDSRHRFELTMVREGVGFFGPTEGADVQLCERAGVESCDGIGPVVETDMGTPIQPGEPDAGVPAGDDDLFGPGNGGGDADAGPGGPSVISAEGGCCAQWRGGSPAPWWLALALTVWTIGRSSRRASKRPS